MKFLTSLLVFLIPTFSLIVLQYAPYLLSLVWTPSAQKMQFSSATVSAGASSIWCTECSPGHKCCELENLLYFPKDRTFGFILTEESGVHGISTGAEFGQILTTSVVNHTDFFLPLVLFSKNDPALKLVKSTLKGPIFLISRFKPDNVMHALHDDLLPLFARYEALCKGDVAACSKEILLAPFDSFENFNAEWYRALTHTPQFNLTGLDAPVLISRALVGMPGSTVVYQYGFGRPQGPVDASASAVGTYQRFAKFMRRHLNINPKLNPQTLNVLLITRKETRRILNEDEVMSFAVQSIQNTLGYTRTVDVKELDLNAAKSVWHTITAISEADLIVGMHGAATFLAGVFSKTNASILELFPYGINPAFVSPLRSLSKISGSWFSYTSWENKDPKLTVPPPDEWPALIGGLGSLSAEERDLAKKQVPVPAVHCCHNSSYLYRMFQDTKVGPSVQYSILKAVEALKTERVGWTKSILMPGRVRNVMCLGEVEGSKVFWKPPINIESLEKLSGLKYEITAQSKNGEFLEVTSSNLFAEFFNQPLHEVWVRACCHDLCGTDTFVVCV